MKLTKNKNDKKNFYITTTLPYINAKPHLGHALEFVRADIVARYKRGLGFDVFFNTGTDEHGLKIYRKALELNKKPQEYVDEYADVFKNFVRKLGMLPDLNFIRTTDEHHIQAAREFWKICDARGDIYKKNYKVKYCVGCELEKSESELTEGKCLDHPNLDIEIIEEENYFFRFSKYQKPLLDFYAENPDFVIPDFRFNEIKKFVEMGLEDFSISRLKSKMPWGIPVPGDENQIMYVWFDALVNYISAVGWPASAEATAGKPGIFWKWWPVTQYCGKDNLRQQSAIWQAMLMSAGFPPSRQIIINGFILGEGGVKMSKSLGNTMDPVEIVDEYGTDALRFYLARHVHSFEDSEFTLEKFKSAYNADLANGLGNLVSRIMKMAEMYLHDANPQIKDDDTNKIPESLIEAFEKFDIQEAVSIIWQRIGELDKKIQKTEPFKLVKTNPEKAKKIIQELVSGLYEISQLLNPILPETSEIIKNLVGENKTPNSPLFPRKE